MDWVCISRRHCDVTEAVLTRPESASQPEREGCGVGMVRARQDGRKSDVICVAARRLDVGVATTRAKAVSRNEQSCVMSIRAWLIQTSDGRGETVKE